MHILLDMISKHHYLRNIHSGIDYNKLYSHMKGILKSIRSKYQLQGQILNNNSNNNPVLVIGMFYNFGHTFYISPLPKQNQVGSSGINLDWDNSYRLLDKLPH